MNYAIDTMCSYICSLITLRNIPTDPMTQQGNIKVFADSCAQFSNNLFSELSLINDGNMVLSGYSAMSVLAMVYSGAESNTAKQMKSGLCLPNDDASECDFFSGISDVIRVSKSTKSMTLEIANTMFPNDDIILTGEFIRSMSDIFHSRIKSLHYYKPEVSRKYINDWVSVHTRDKINDLIPRGILSSSTRVVLINSIYFKGEWASKFNVDDTEYKDFFISPDKTVSVPMMHSNDAKFGLRKDEGIDATILEIPYEGNRMNMYIILPNTDIDTTENKMYEGIDIIPIFKSIKRHKRVRLSLPKFRIESTHDLAQPLKNIGMTDMFKEETADFSGIAESDDLFISSVIQKVIIEVNEEGSVAAAASMVDLSMRSMPTNPRVFNVNKPFIFAIKDTLTETILFSGRVVDPTV